jgi:hypothetical protein
MTKLSDMQRVILSRAAQHDALLATPPAKLPAAARQAVLRSMIGKGLLEEVPAPREAIRLSWRQDEDGVWIALRITTAGLAAIDLPPCLGFTWNERVGLLGRRQGCRRSDPWRSRSSGCYGRLRWSWRRAGRWGRSAAASAYRWRASTAGERGELLPLAS